MCNHYGECDTIGIPLYRSVSHIRRDDQSVGCPVYGSTGEEIYIFLVVTSDVCIGYPTCV